MELYLKGAGYIMIALSLIHVSFPSYFNWKRELPALSLINRQLMYVHTFFVALVVLLMGIFCVCEAGDIINTTLGHKYALGMFIFWATRLIFQFAVYSPELWRGKSFELFMHVLFSFVWVYFTVLFFLIYRTPLGV